MVFRAATPEVNPVPDPRIFLNKRIVNTVMCGNKTQDVKYKCKIENVKCKLQIAQMEKSQAKQLPIMGYVHKQ